MTPEQFQQFLSATFTSYRQTCEARGATMGTSAIPHPGQREFQNVLESAGFKMRCQIIWAKNTFAWGFGRYKFQHEPISYAQCREAEGSLVWRQIAIDVVGEKEAGRQSYSPHCKPVELIERAFW